ncbi:sodium/hydrogen exchanger 9B1 isoform 2-T2 [Dama dama]|uniref:sodium/hydrogen exchanger 9B1 isoform X3 n=1 Tax=Dama dama TaxID=30532 RepID=UPI002A359027|nr:sodium/hydrogen exchanger 9B1 isoform X3 [Dama dama]
MTPIKRVSSARSRQPRPLAISPAHTRVPQRLPQGCAWARRRLLCSLRCSVGSGRSCSDCSMYTKEPQNEHLEDENVQSSTITETLKADEHEETKETILPETEETKSQIEEKVFCPSLNRAITSGSILFMIWCVAWVFSGPEVLPNGGLFGLLIIFYCALIGGKLLEIIKIPSVPKIPPLLGMLLAGFVVRNVPFLSDVTYISNELSSTLRNTALTIILVRAGLGLDPEALKNLKRVCIRLSMGPCLMEACSTAVISHFLMNFPWKWAFLLGFVVGAVSPAVVVPSMLRLQEKGYGVEKGIPTLLIAASSLDDIVSISGFNACFSIVFSSGNISNNILSPLRDAGLGVLSGIVLGMFARHFPSSDQVRVQKIIGIAWDIFQPLLFGLVGAEVSVASLKSNAIGVSVGTVSLALLVRISFTFILMSCAGFNFKEKIFIALSWMPKATVQAVLGPLALEKARMSAPHLESYSKDVMTVAFLSILITAPNGALIIGILGPKLLTRYDTNKVKMELSGSQPH